MNRSALCLALVIAVNTVASALADETIDPKGLPKISPYRGLGDFDATMNRGKEWQYKAKPLESDSEQTYSLEKQKTKAVVKSPVLSGGGVIYSGKDMIHNYPKSAPHSYGDSPKSNVGDFYAGMRKGKWVDNNIAAPKPASGEVIDNHAIQGKLIKKDNSEH